MSASSASRALRRYAEELGRVPELAGRAAGEAVGQIAAEEARRATGDGRMSGMGRRGPVLRTVARTSSTGCVIDGVPAGGWSILEGGAGAHVIGPPRRRNGSLSGSLRHPVRVPIRHPGSPPKGTWGRVTARADETVPELVDELVARALS